MATGEELLGGEIGSEGEYRAAFGVANDARATEEFVAQRVDAAQQEQGATLGAGTSRWRSERDLKVGHQVVREHREDLPGAVGGEVAGGDDIEGVAVLELSKHFLVSADIRP